MRSRGTRRLGMDMMTLLFLSMAAILYILLAYINIPKKQTMDTPKLEGGMMVQLFWPDGLDTDVDLWVRSESDGIAVGYSNKGGPLFNLLRDDLGGFGDISGKNEEFTVSRGLPDGEYIVNAHLFNLKDGNLPIPLRVIVSARSNETSSFTQLFAVSGELRFPGEEKTMARFKMRDGKYVEESFSTTSVSIRAFTGGGQ